MELERINFTPKVKKTVRADSGERCSNPSCRKLLQHYSELDNKTANLGDVGHIFAAASGGPRASNYSEDYLKSEANAIFLCTGCHRLVDSCELKFPAEKLMQWKVLAKTNKNEENMRHWVYAGEGRLISDDIDQCSQFLNDIKTERQTLYYLMERVKSGSTFSLKQTLTSDIHHAIRLISVPGNGPQYSVISEMFRAKAKDVIITARELKDKIKFDDINNYQFTNGFVYIGEKPKRMFEPCVIQFNDDLVKLIHVLLQQANILEDFCQEVKARIYL